jgi:hypothetical protein
MADLTAADITVTLDPQDIDVMTWNKVVMPKLAFGDGAKTIPAGGIPLPALASFGLHKAIKRGHVIQPADGYVYRIDRANHKLMVFYGDYSNASDGVLVEAAGVAPAATEIELTLIGQ